MQSPSPRIERARPLLGTTVSIRVHGLGESAAQQAINEAFTEIAVVHRLMSFQEPQSEISRLNREAFGRTQDVHPATFEVLHWALAIAKASEGCFDITVAGRLVEWGILPAPASGHLPDPAADWRDIELADDMCVRFRRPLWIDVSGIAKGYAVDRAVEKLRSHGATQACVNAGGDLRVYGREREHVAIRTADPAMDALPLLDIENAAVASSSGYREEGSQGSEAPGPHVDAKTGRPVASDRFATVVAETCLLADALTKPALILQEKCAALLQVYGATAHLHDPSHGWRHLPA